MAESSNTKPPRMPPPDGGWGWVIAGAAFIINAVVLGIHNSFGLFLDYFIENRIFGVTDKSTAAVAAIGSLSFGMTYMFGPVSGLLCDRFGIRLTVILGGLISIAGILVTSFCTELYHLYITYGILWGCGSSLCYTASFVALGQYFHKRISFVNGLATAGSGIGGLGLTPLIAFTLETTGWRNTYRILAGITAVLALTGLVLSPVESSKSKFDCCGLRKKITSSKSDTVDNPQTSRTINIDKKDDEELVQSNSSHVHNNVDTLKENEQTTATEACTGGMRQKRNVSIRFQDEIFTNDAKMQIESSFNAAACKNRANSDSSSDIENGIVINLDHGKPDDIEDKNVSEDINTEDHRKKHHFKAFSAGLKRFKKAFSFIDLSNWHKKPYVAWVIAVGIVEICYFIPYIYLVKFAGGIGIGKDNANMLIAYLGIVATVSKMAIGRMCDHPKMNRIYFIQLCALAMAVCITCLPLVTDYAGILAFIVVFGWFDGCYTTLLAVITLDVTSSATYAQGLGQMYIVMAVADMVGPVVIGEIYAQTSSFEIPFYITGAVFFIGSCAMFLISYFTPNRTRMTKDASMDSISSFSGFKGLRRSSSFAGFDLTNYAVPIKGVAYSNRIRRIHKVSFRKKSKKQPIKEAPVEKDYRNIDPTHCIIVDRVSLV